MFCYIKVLINYSLFYSCERIYSYNLHIYLIDIVLYAPNKICNELDKLIWNKI